MLLAVPFDMLMDFHRALPDQEQSAGDEYQVTHGEGLAEQGKQVNTEMRQPEQQKQQQQARDHGDQEADLPAFFALFLRQASNQDGNKDNVIDAEHDFQGGQSYQCYPSLYSKYPVKHIDLQWFRACRLTGWRCPGN